MNRPRFTIVKTIGTQFLTALVSGLMLSGILFSPASLGQAEPPREYFELDETCTVSILNRVVQADNNGDFFLQNVPSFLGQVRARATCVSEDLTVTGQTDYFDVLNNSTVDVGGFYKTGSSRIPVDLIIAGAPSATILSLVELYTLLVSAEYADGAIEDVSFASSGINYQSSNEAIASVSADGIVTPHMAGTVLVTARKDGVLAVITINIVLSGDADLDGIPDDIELANGLDPANPFDALEDIDGDGLSALEEYNVGTSLFDPDSDGDGINDGEELIEGGDGYITNPLLRDTDNDGLSDGIEISVGSSPIDINDANYAAAVINVSVIPDIVVMNFNTINAETSTQLKVQGHLIDASTIDLTSKSTGTTYASSDLAIVSFGADDGVIFAGSSGSATVTVSYLSFNVAVPVTVETFVPSAIAQLNIGGSGVDTEIAGDYLYVAASSGGMHIIDVTDRAAPVQVGNFATTGSANDIKVVGEIAYVAALTGGVDIVDISDPTNPTLLSNIDTAGSTRNIIVDRQLLFAASSNAGLEIFDVRDSENPFRLSFLDNLGSVSDVALENDIAVVIGGSSLILIDISDPLSPMRLGSINVGNLRAVAINGDYAYVAAYTSGFKVFDISNPLLPVEVSAGTGFYPSDIALTNGFAFFSDILFINAVPYVNTDDPTNAFFQGVIDIREFGDRDAVGLSLDSSFVYSTGGTKLYISQYRQLSDSAGIPPTVAISSEDWNFTEVVVEGDRILISADATDDVAVASVGFYIDDVLRYTDTTAPYRFPYDVPSNVNALSIYAIATDLGDNSASSPTTNLTVEPDADGDGLGDFEELLTWGTDVNNPDTDGDGVEDGVEADIGTNPLSPDSDGDGISDGDEIANDTDPLNPDTTLPEIASSSPAPNDIDVPENQAINVIFNEPLRANTVTPAAFLVLPNGGGSAVTGSLALTNGRTQLTFTPAALMADNTEHTVRIEGIKDEAGNVILPTEFTFVTGNFIDTVRPSLLDISPVNVATDVPLNSLITVILSEPIKPETVTDDSFYVIDEFTGLRFEGITTVADDKASILFTPNTPFLVGRRYRTYINSGIHDLFDLPFISTSRYFNTSFEQDVTAPQFSFASFPDGTVDVPVNARFGVKFSERINSLYTSQIMLLDEFGDEILIARSMSADRKTVVLDPVVDLDSNADYLIVIDGVEDLSGNLLPVPSSVGFTTGTQSDTSQGGILHWSYPANAVLPPNAVLEVALTERIDATTANSINGIASFILYSNTQGRFFPGEGVLDDTGTRIRYVPGEPLQAGHSYRLYVTYNVYLYDLAGNRINGTGRTFTVSAAEDLAAPVFDQSNFADGATDIAVNSKVKFRVNEPLSDSCLSGIALEAGGIAADRSIGLSSDRRTVTITPSANLATSTNYTLSLDGLCDYAGNGLTTTLLSFTTAASDIADTTAPSLQTIAPAANTTGVSVDTTITMTFNEPVSLLTAPEVLAGGVTISGSYDVNGNTIVFTPASSLPEGVQVRTYVYVADYAGNFSGTYRYFNTEVLNDITAPTVVAMAPTTNAIDVDPATSVVLSFDEPMAPTTINSTNILFYTNGAILSPSVFRSADGANVTLSANLPAFSVVTVVITDRVTDLSGNAIEPYASSFTTAERTIDSGRPSISRVLPANGSSGLIGINQIVMYANEELEASSVIDGFHIAEDGVLIDSEGVLEVLGDGRTIQFTKDTPFTEGTRVQVYLSDVANDLANNPLNNYTAYFTMGTTGDGVGVKPTPIRYSTDRDLPLNPVIQVLYSEPLDPASLLNDNVYLYHVAGGTRVPISFSLNTTVGDPGQETVPGQILTVVPDNLLVAGDQYYIFLNGNITDTDGDNQQAARSHNFYVADSAVEDDRAAMVTAINPPDGEINVGVNPHYSVRYDEPINTMVFDSPALVNLQFSENNQVIRYQRTGALPSETEVTETLPETNDLGGNAVASASTTFTTRLGADLSNGTVSSVSVVNGATNVVFNPILTREYNEPIDPVSVTASGVYLYDDVTGLVVPTTLTHSADGRRLTLVPLSALAPGQRYHWYSFSLRDLSGNTMQNGNSYFDTGFESDDVGPTLESMTVIDGQSNVPTNVRLSVGFDEPINPFSVDNFKLLDGSATPVPANISFSGDRRTVTLVPVQLLNANASYTLNVAGLEDISGNVLPAPISPAFSTGSGIDNLPGSIVFWSYPANALLPPNALLEVELSERIDATTVNTTNGTASFILYSNTQTRFISGQGVIDNTGTRLRYVPDEPLQAGHSYRLYVTYNVYLNDLAGNRINGTGRTFTVSAADDLAAPVVEQSSFADGATNIAVNSKAMFRVNEPLSESCLSGIVLEAGGSTAPRSISLSSDRRTVTVTPTGNLTADTIYSLTLDGLCDYAGNGLTTTLLSFTTAASDIADSTAPSLQTITPVANASGISVDTDITMVFNEPVSLLATPEVLAGGVTIPGSYDVNGDTIVFTPASSLPEGVQVRTYVYVADYAGNFLSTYRYFNTENLDDISAPTVVAIAPSTNAIDVDPATSVVLSFDEPMAPATINSANVLFYTNGAILNPTVFRSADGVNVTLSANLPAFSIVTVVVTDRVTDLSGNPIEPYSSSFTTASNIVDSSRPSIVRILPANGSSGWIDIKEITMYANESLDPTSVANAFHIVEDGVLIDSEVTLDVLGNGRVVRISRPTPFSAGKRVRIYLSDVAKDLANNPLNNYTAYFNTGTSIGDGLGVRPLPVRYSTDRELPLNPVIQVLYSEPLNPLSLLNDNVYLRHVPSNTNVPISLSLNTTVGDPGQETVPGQILTVVPDNLLVAGDRYYIYLTGNVTDTDGDTQSSARSHDFYIADDAVEDDRAAVVTAINPPDGEADIGVNPYYSVRYDEPINTMVFGSPTLVNLQFSENNQLIRYERLGVLPANTEVTETIPKTNDLGGNPVASTSTTFTTMAGPDVQSGSITQISIPSSTKNVARNPILMREFNEAIDPASVSETGVYLYDGVTGLHVPVSRALSADGKRLTMVPMSVLNTSQIYYWYGTGLRDLSGNSMQASSYNFSTGTEVDIIGPTIASMTVYDTQTEIPTNVRLRVNFNEPIDPFSISGVEVRDNIGNPLTVNVSFSADRRTMTVVPKQLLAANSSFDFVVDSVKDVSGNLLAAPVTTSFTTASGIDNVVGAITTWSFNTNAVLPLNTRLEVEVNDRIDPTRIDTTDGVASIALYNNTDQRFILGNGVLSGDSKRIQFVPDEVLEVGDSYRLYITYNLYLYDLASNRINGGARTFIIGAEDNEPPTIRDMTFADGLLDAPLNMIFRTRFHEPLNPFAVAGIKLTDSLSAQVPSSISFSSDRLTANLTPDQLLAPNSSYTLTVQDAEDLSGNVMVGISTQSLVTGTSSDTTQGSISSWSFTSGEVLAADALLEVVLSERVDPTTVDTTSGQASIALYSNTEGRFMAGEGAVSVDGLHVSFERGEPLLPGHSYRLYYTYNTYTFDLAGNRINGTSRVFTVTP